MSVSLHINSSGPAMPTHLKLVAHYTERTRGGFSFGTAESTFIFDSGLTLQIPAPFLPIGEELAIAPVVTKDGDNALRTDLSRWTPLRYGPRGVRSFPFTFSDQDTAAKVCRAFDADPRMSWQHTAGEIEAWLREWGPPNGLHL